MKESVLSFEEKTTPTFKLPANTKHRLKLTR